MKSTTKLLNTKIILGFVFTIVIHQSFASCQTSSANNNMNITAIDLLMNETANYESVKPDNIYIFPKSEWQVEHGEIDIDSRSESNSGLINELFSRDVIEDEMLVEDWMINEFNINDDLTNDTQENEEEMEVEEWMTNSLHWEKSN